MVSSLSHFSVAWSREVTALFAFMSWGNFGSEVSWLGVVCAVDHLASQTDMIKSIGPQLLVFADFVSGMLSTQIWHKFDL